MSDRLQVEQAEAQSNLSEASEAVRQEAKQVGAQAQEMAGEQAEKVKEAAASHLDVIADALRAASDELGRNQSGPAAEMVSNAASGLEGLTRSLHGQSTGEMIETVRRFGRENPVGFLAGSVLAGLALGRFASVATTAAAGSDERQRSTATSAGGTGPITGQEVGR
ncbi:hypothetical protein PZ895_14140 [Mesorhizobium sp. YIM 152430]|uniref:hypothetical protein n=1 Tax=Mesorhizobium sp. YIM 152430 TaxID=3031761 RepID=UPI0023DB7941|nr:hypothetical protein [Mesorhizobium sp. YIM 152430]MDF1600903.1 hypothetical protein [Mesorhizobium sp. YIM 152430]